MSVQNSCSNNIITISNLCPDVLSEYKPHVPRLVTKTPILDGNSIEQKRQEIRQYFHDTFSLYESLFQCLAAEKAFYARPNQLRHPLIFYYGHTSVFYINKLNEARFIDQRVDTNLESLFAVGVDEMPWDEIDDKIYDWPTIEQVRTHRQATRRIVDNFIMGANSKLPISWDDPLWIVMMGIEHERIHLETSSVLIRELSIQDVCAHDIWGKISNEVGCHVINNFLEVQGGKVSLGKSPSNQLYGWDNEYGKYEETVNPFKASQYLVSNEEFFGFVKDGGYKNSEFWAKEGWKWVIFKKAQLPTYWIKQKNGNFQLRTMLEEIDMPWSWPAEVNYFEAKAFCNWKSKQTSSNIRLLTESEYGLLRGFYESDQPYWKEAPGNINLEGTMSPCPVNHHKFQGGFFDIVGNVWQWTETTIFPFDGFQAHYAYDDFSTPTFDGKHNIFKGGSWVSTGNCALGLSRYAFRQNFLQYSGFRYVDAQSSPRKEANVYEQDDTVSMYIEFHYGKQYLNVPNYPMRCAQEAILHLDEFNPRKRALDLGCACGRSAFELATEFEKVEALDLSARLLEFPYQLQNRGVQSYSVRGEGDLFCPRKACLSDFQSYLPVVKNVHFAQGDACNLGTRYTNYDLILAANLIDRLYDPAKFLRDVKHRVREGGLLVITSPYTWLENFTRKEKWLGGFKTKSGEEITTLKGIEIILSPEFVLVNDAFDIEFVMRETNRKFQHSFAQFSAWKRV